MGRSLLLLTESFLQVVEAFMAALKVGAAGIIGGLSSHFVVACLP